MRASRRGVLAAGAAVLTGIAAGCARIPTSSPVSASPLADPGKPGAPYVQALPPADGASPVDVVAGFVQAGVGPEDGYAVARQYLTKAERERWRPEAGVSVYAGGEDLTVSAVSDAAVTLAITLVSSVDGTGVRSQPLAPTARTFSFELERVGEQWRISSAPDGVYLSEAAFETLFAPGRLYFPEPRSRHLVPDHRWFAVHDGPSAVMRGLAAGPQELLKGAVHNAVPQTSGVTDAPVSAGADGTAQVTVPAAVGALPAQARALALAQLETSLRALPSLPDVQLVWSGPDLTPAHGHPAQRAVPGHRAIGAGRTGVVSLADPPAGAPAQLIPALRGRRVRGPVMARDGSFAAALSDDGSSVLIADARADAPVREASSGGLLVPPALDDAGWVWTSTRTGSGALLVLARGGSDQDLALDAAWLAGREVRSLAIAPDATRMLVVSADAGSARLDLCAIRRDGSGLPRSISEPVPVRTTVAQPAQASWYDELAVICLGASHEELGAAIVLLDGDEEPLPHPRAGTDRIAGTAVADSIWASTVDGALLRATGGEWTDSALEVVDPAFY